MSFKNRWLITGTLKTLTPLHVGTGERLTFNVRDSNVIAPPGGDQVEVAEVAIDCRGKPVLTGSGIKGNLRQWADRRLREDVQVELDPLLGSRNQKDPEAVGGKTNFWDAQFSNGIDDESQRERVPYFSISRQTGVAARVAINRRTRTVIDDRLFHVEYVPPGVTFELQIGGQDLEDREVSLILAALQGFNQESDPVRLGADLVNDWGRCAWTLGDVRRITASELKERLASETNPLIGYEWCQSLDESQREAVQVAIAFRSSSVLTLELELAFDGGFLVNEPARTKQGPDPNDETPNFTPRLTPEGKALLPAQGVRGPIRAQAERIVRTLCEAHAPAPNLPHPERDRRPNLIEQIFGLTGQAARIRFSDFTSARPVALQPQEFVAIDRFTGGAAPGLKFRGEFIESPVLTGTVTVDLEHVQPWGLGLLALVLRDLIEGDVAFGFGAAKGYGACRARIVRATPPNSLKNPSPYPALLAKCELNLDAIRYLDPSQRPVADEIELLVMDLTKCFRKTVADPPG